MSRAYKVIDGTLRNIGRRITDDYEASGFSCDSSVGDQITSDLESKLELPMIKSLGFTADNLTISMGDIEVANANKIDEVVRELYNVGAYCDMEFNGSYPNHRDTIEFLKGKKTEFVHALYDERTKRERDLGRIHNQYVSSAFVSLVDKHEFAEAFRTNDPERALFGIKPSKFLSRYVEKLIPGITEKYALAHSETHKLHVMLTIDPNIMINCSESATFSSCFTHDGEYHYSAQRYANSKDAVMAVVFDDNGRILARNWVMISPSRDAVLTLQVYSSIGGGTLGSAMNKLTRSFVLDTEDYISGDYDAMRIGNADESYIDEYGFHVLSDYDRNWTPSLGKAYDIDDGSTTYECELHSGISCDHCGERTGDTQYVADYGDVCDYCLGKHFTYVEHRDHYVRDTYVVHDRHGEPQHENDVETTHDEHERTDELYPKGELKEAYEGGMYEPEELTHSEMFDRWYYDCSVLDEDEEEYLEDTKEEGE